MTESPVPIPSLQASGLSFAFYPEAGGVLLKLEATGERLIIPSKGCLFAPIIDGICEKASLVEIEPAKAAVFMRWDFPAAQGIEGFRFCIEANEHGYDLWCEFQATRDCQVNAIQLFPQETVLNLYHVVNFRNRHFTAQQWPELLLGADMETSTYSDDWQFAPHPTVLLLTKNDVSLFFGALDVKATFGMRLKTKRHRLNHWTLDYGPHPHGLTLKKGERFASSRMRLFMQTDRSAYEMYTRFGEMLIAEGYIADPAAKPRHAWWMEPLYCTWTDQCLLSRSQVAVELAEQTGGDASKEVSFLSEAMVRRAVDVIRRERLPIRTIILDEGWAIARGDWRPHPKRFPNLRGLVDELHAQGFKVMVWWTWSEVADDASVEPSHLAGGGWRNKYGRGMRDYSNPATQTEYLIPLMRQLFSNEPGCLDLDGVKTDFLADKIHPEIPLFDPIWRGEERYFSKITELFYREMRRHKSDAMHLAGSGNYWLAEFIDLNRTYDVHCSNWQEHEERARMLSATTPGVPVSYDMMVVTENTPQWFESAKRLHAAVEIGNVLAMKDDIASEPRETDPAYFEMLRKYLVR